MKRLTLSFLILLMVCIVCRCWLLLPEVPTARTFAFQSPEFGGFTSLPSSVDVLWRPNTPGDGTRVLLERVRMLQVRHIEEEGRISAVTLEVTEAQAQTLQRALTTGTLLYIHRIWAKPVTFRTVVQHVTDWISGTDRTTVTVKEIVGQ